MGRRQKNGVVGEKIDQPWLNSRVDLGRMSKFCSQNIINGISSLWFVNNAIKISLQPTFLHRKQSQFLQSIHHPWNDFLQSFQSLHIYPKIAASRAKHNFSNTVPIARRKAKQIKFRKAFIENPSTRNLSWIHSLQTIQKKTKKKNP